MVISHTVKIIAKQGTQLGRIYCETIRWVLAIRQIPREETIAIDWTTEIIVKEGEPVARQS